MTTANWLETIAAVVAVLFAMVTATLGLVIRMSMRWAKLEADTKHVQRSFDQHVIDSQRRTDVIVETAKDDRKAANDRITWLERGRMSPWPSGLTAGESPH